MIKNFKYLRGVGKNGLDIRWMSNDTVIDEFNVVHPVFCYSCSVDNFINSHQSSIIYFFYILIDQYPVIYERNWLNEEEYIRLSSTNDNTNIWAVVLPRRN